jgi:hypothetical protein
MAKKLFLIAAGSKSDFGKSLEWFLEENQQLENALCVDVDRDGVFASSKTQFISSLPSIRGSSCDVEAAA